jgi:hypothetical protein
MLLDLLPDNARERFLKEIENIRVIPSPLKRVNLLRSLRWAHGLDNPSSAISINDRLQSGRFFVFPGEVVPNKEQNVVLHGYGAEIPLVSVEPHKNCFEQSFHLLLGARELYPESNPRLIFLDEGKRGTHAVVFFNHDGHLYAGCPSYKIFNKVALEKGRLVFFEDDGKVVKKIKINGMTEIPDSALEDLIKRLSAPSGFKEFLTGSGQLVERGTSGYRPYDLFMKLNEKGELVSELRFTDFQYHTCIRKIITPGKRKRGEFLVYQFNNWGELCGEKVFARTPEEEFDSATFPDWFAGERELRKGDVDEFLFKYFVYSDIIRWKANEDKQNLDKTFLTDEECRKKAEEAWDSVPGIKEFLLNQTHSFKQHYFDYRAFVDRENFRTAFRGHGRIRKGYSVRDIIRRTGYYTKKLNPGIEEVRTDGKYNTERLLIIALAYMGEVDGAVLERKREYEMKAVELLGFSSARV